MIPEKRKARSCDSWADFSWENSRLDHIKWQPKISQVSCNKMFLFKNEWLEKSSYRIKNLFQGSMFNKELFGYCFSQTLFSNPEVSFFKI